MRALSCLITLLEKSEFFTYSLYILYIYIDMLRQSQQADPSGVRSCCRTASNLRQTLARAGTGEPAPFFKAEQPVLVFNDVTGSFTGHVFFFFLFSFSRYVVT